MAEEANIHWLALGQVAQAVRDHALLDEVSDLHKQTLTQIKWLKTRIGSGQRAMNSLGQRPAPAARWFGEAQA